MYEEGIIEEWCRKVIEGLHVFESREMAVARIPRDEAVARWVIRCLGNVKNDGSEEVLEAILDHRLHACEVSDAPA